jgi:threonine dehydrogenase-like Zn-dependent dehydrogenase
MKALIFTAPNECSVQEVPEPVRRPGETLVAPRFVGLCATDQEMLQGVMPYLADGLARYPVQAAHEVSGVVVESDADGPAPGTPVTIDPVVGCGRCAACLRGVETHCPDRLEMGLRLGMPGGAAELIAVPTRKLHPVPEGLSLRSAVFVEPGVTSYNGVKRFGDVSGKRALVLGPGTLGCIAAQLLAAGGASVAMHDPAGTRRGLIAELGAEAVPEIEPDSYDLVIEAMGAPSAIHDGLRAVAAGGQIALLGVQPGTVPDVDVNALVFKDATMFGVLNGPGLYDELLTRMAAGDVTPEVLLEADFPLERAPEAFELMARRGRTRPKIQLVLGGDS